MITLNDIDPKDVKIASLQCEINRLNHIISQFKDYDKERKSYLKAIYKELETLKEKYFDLQKLYKKEQEQHKGLRGTHSKLVKQFQEYKKNEKLLELFDYSDSIEFKRLRGDLISLKEENQRLKKQYKSQIDSLFAELAKLRNDKNLILCN